MSTVSTHCAPVGALYLYCTPEDSVLTLYSRARCKCTPEHSAFALYSIFDSK